MNRYASLPAIYVPGAYRSLPVIVESILRKGLPIFRIGGLIYGQLQDTTERIKSALQACEKRLPCLSFVVNLAPVDVKKRGAYLDLSIAVCILRALQEKNSRDSLLSSPPDQKTLYLGELSLSGAVREIPNLLAILWEARRHNFQRIVLPESQKHLASIVPDLQFFPISHISELKKSGRQSCSSRPKIEIVATKPPSSLHLLDLSPHAQKALALSAAGWHSLLLIGPPGCGKSTIAKEIAALLPEPGSQEALEILVGQQDAIPQQKEKGEAMLSIARPIRNPHHSSSRRALVGGGSPILPGEVTHAHNGLLILDELGEFSRETLQALREPLQERCIHLSKGADSAWLPARFLLCATSNPCPCGDLANRFVRCACSDFTLKNYLSRFMGALRDRIDIEVEVNRGDDRQAERYSPDEIHKMIENARLLQERRFHKSGLQFNGDVKMEDVENYMPLKMAESRTEWVEIINCRWLSHRALAGIRRLARTIADLDKSEEIRPADLLEATAYRCLDSFWTKTV